MTFKKTRLKTPSGIFLLPFLLIIPGWTYGQTASRDSRFSIRSSLYLDWYGSQQESSGFFSQLGARLKFELTQKTDKKWSLLIDVRDRQTLSKGSRNRFLVYNARLNYDPPASPWSFQIGQMNLYDTAGIGQLLGFGLGFRLSDSFLLGGYAGFEQQIYFKTIDTHYQKAGAFFRYTGPKGASFVISYNHLRFSGKAERQSLYGQAFASVKKVLFLYGLVEYELGPYVETGDRLTRLFINARLDAGRFADLSSFYSSGRGLDFHRYIIERSQNPGILDPDLERFFYSRQYGLRLALKPARNSRFYISRQESEQIDRNIKNHTWRFGASATNLLAAGLSAYGDYSLNRGSNSESDSYYLSLNKDFGRLSLSVRFSNTFNSLRFDASGSQVEVVHLSDHKTIGTDLNIVLNRNFILSLDYGYMMRTPFDEHQFFARIIFRR